MRKNIIKNAIIWAALMLATAYLMRGVEGNNQFIILMLQVAGFIAVDQIIRGKDNCKKEED
ncbi:MAG: hypothetical protein KAR62_04375 [Sphingomonadales bacterium]|nr:hypothetical protein [Sphingomonadales bacterium]